MASNLDTACEKGPSVHHFTTTTTTTITTKPVPDETSTTEEQHLKPPHDLSRAIWTILAGVALPCIPIIIVTTVLLYFIFRHQLILSPGWPELRTIPTAATHTNLTQLLKEIRKQGGSKAYYVQYNASTITTIASWTGRVIPYLSSSIMALVAFYAARHIVLKSKHGDGSDLPNPAQLTILIGVLGGTGFGPLKDTLLYRFGKREKLISPLPAAFAALFIITILGILIPIIDSWFGIATTTVTVDQLYPRQPVLSYGRNLSYSTCPDGVSPIYDDGCLVDKYAFWPCNIEIPECRGYPFVVGISDSARISLGISQTNAINNYTDASGTVYHYLTGPEQNTKVDYKATTIATSSQCMPMTKHCYTDPLLNGTDWFNCTSAFAGNLGETILNISANPLDPINPANLHYPNIGLAFSNNPQLTETGGMVNGFSEPAYNWSLPQIYPTNPLYYGVWATGYPAPDPYYSDVNLNGSNGIYYDNTTFNEGGIWLLNCSTTVYEVSYTWINGAINSFNHTLATGDMAGLLSGPFSQLSYNGYTLDALGSVANAAGSHTNPDDLTRTFANSFSGLLLAYANGALGPVLNEYEQGRNSSISVARIPIIPLYLLLATKAAYVITVIILAIGAYCFTHPAETEIVKAQLSAKGLAAAHFQQPNLAQQRVVKELQNRIDIAKGKAQPPPSPPTGESGEGPTPEKAIARASTAPVHGSDKPQAVVSQDAKIGLLPDANGVWQFVVVANGVWNSIKPVVENLILTDANAGGLGTAGQVISAWK